MFFSVFRSLLRAAAVGCLSFAAAAAAAAADPPHIAAFGDSLSAGYGVAEAEGFAPQLQSALARRGVTVTVSNAAISGNTSADGRRRVDWMLRRQQPDMVIVALGANDMLRGLPVEQMYNNLDTIITRITAAGATVLLAGMLATPTMGEAYAAAFAAAYQRLAEEHQVAFYPFFLQDVATIPSLNLPDGLHPNPAGIRVMAENIAPLAESLLR